MCVFYTEALLLYHRHHQQHKHTRGLKLASILCLVWCQQIWLSICAKALTSHPTYCTKRCRAKEDGREAPERKRKVLHLVSQWMALCRDFLREDEHVKVFMKVREHDVPRKAWNGVWAETNVEGMKTDISFQTLYRCVLDDLYAHPALEKDVRELQKLHQPHRRQWVLQERTMSPWVIGLKWLIKLIYHRFQVWVQKVRLWPLVVRGWSRRTRWSLGWEKELLLLLAALINAPIE